MSTFIFDGRAPDVHACMQFAGEERVIGGTHASTIYMVQILVFPLQNMRDVVHSSLLNLLR